MVLQISKAEIRNPTGLGADGASSDFGDGATPEVQEVEANASRKIYASRLLTSTTFCGLANKR